MKITVEKYQRQETRLKDKKYPKTLICSVIIVVNKTEKQLLKYPFQLLIKLFRLSKLF